MLQLNILAVGKIDALLHQQTYLLQQGLLAERVTASYKQGEWWSYIDLLLGAHNIRDLVARTELVNRVMRANSDTAEQLSATKRFLDREKADLDQTLAEIAAKRREAETVEASLKGLQNARQDKADAQQAVLDEKSTLLSSSQKNAKRLLAIATAEEAESARIKAEWVALFKQTYVHVVRPLGWMRPDPVQDVPAAHEFAQLLGGIFLSAGTILLATGWLLTGWTLTWIVIFLAAANLFFGFCAGCFVYYQIGRLGVPGFRTRPEHGGGDGA